MLEPAPIAMPKAMAQPRPVGVRRPGGARGRDRHDRLDEDAVRSQPDGAVASVSINGPEAVIAQDGASVESDPGDGMAHLRLFRAYLYQRAYGHLARAALLLPEVAAMLMQADGDAGDGEDHQAP